METCIIRGNRNLDGRVTISGSKNASLCLIAASLVPESVTLFHNIPRLNDVNNFLSILTKLNIKYEWTNNNSLKIDARSITLSSLLIKEVSSFRASYYLIGALLPKFKKMDITYPGGCAFEKRPIDVHLDLISQLGGSISENEHLSISLDTYKTNTVKLSKVSFGATVNAILLGIQSKEDFYIENASQECEIDALIDYLNTAGSNINRILPNKIHIKATNSFHDSEFSNIPDRMEIGTYAFIGASCGRVRMYPIIRDHILALEKVLYMSDAFYYYASGEFVVEKRKKAQSVIVETETSNGFPTDLQAILTSYLVGIPRIHVIKETIYKNRFSHVDELKKMGAMIIKENDTLLINGIFHLHGAHVVASDLRCAASLVLASLQIDGESRIDHAEILHRGYEDFYKKLKSLGADIGVIS